MKQFNNNLFFEVQRDYLIRCGDPSGSSKGGLSAESILNDKDKVTFVNDEILVNQKMNKKALVCMANKGIEDTNSSQFFITLRDTELDHLSSSHTIVGEIVEGYEELEKIFNSVYVDESFRPLQDIRILHTFILDDPFEDYPNMKSGYDSPDETVPKEENVIKRIDYGEIIDKNEGKTEEEIEEETKKEEAKSRAEILEMVGDLPDADIKPPENVLFVCKLNPITTDEDLELLFSRFGEIKECEIIKDKETGESLQYAFIEFITEEQCNEAYLKMNNVIIDDRRIKVDFSQSVAKIWNKWSMQPRKRMKQTQV